MFLIDSIIYLPTIFLDLRARRGGVGERGGGEGEGRGGRIVERGGERAKWLSP